MLVPVTQPVSIYGMPFPHTHLPVKILPIVQDLSIKSPSLHVAIIQARLVSATSESPGPARAERALNKLAFGD